MSKPNDNLKRIFTERALSVREASLLLSRQIYMRSGTVLPTYELSMSLGAVLLHFASFYVFCPFPHSPYMVFPCVAFDNAVTGSPNPPCVT